MRRTLFPPLVSNQELHAEIERFLSSARKPAVLEPGEPLLLLERDKYVVEERGGALILQAWDEKRNLVRKLRGVERAERGKLTLAVQRFAGREGTLELLDLAHPRTQDWQRRGSRLVFRERFRAMLEREFPEWRVAELSSDADLEHSLSPAYSRAILVRGDAAIAAIAAPPECGNFPATLTFGLVWLEYARQRDPKRTVQALIFWAPSPVAPELSFYLPHLARARTQLAMYLYSDDDYTQRLDPANYGNVSTELERCRVPSALPHAIEPAHAVPLASGAISLRVAGLEFARYHNGELRGGSEPMTWAEAREIAATLHELRGPQSARHTLIYTQDPEAWLEEIVRANIEVIDPSLLPFPIYGQVPAIAGLSRSVMDLLAVDRSGRLAVVELKATQDIHLPLQALDYWIRVKWHLDRDEFSRAGYFPGMALRPDPPRLILVAPSLEFHPATESVLKYFGEEIEVLRVGLGADWRERPRAMFRLWGADRPHE